MRAFPGERANSRRADAARSTGDEGNFAGELTHDPDPFFMAEGAIAPVVKGKMCTLVVLSIRSYIFFP
jgi:hypothetical protein